MKSMLLLVTVLSQLLFCTNTHTFFAKESFPYFVQPLYRHWNTEQTDHYYTTDRGSFKHMGWEFERIECYVFRLQTKGTVPLYRHWNPTRSDHFYTIDAGSFKHIGWNFEKIECYVYPKKAKGSIPLYRYWNEATADHFYTTDWNELKNGSMGYVFERIECYVLPVQ
jgi:Repeat of unknown function (DUF5648)